MFGRKKKEEAEEPVYNPLADNDSNFPITTPSQEEPQQKPQFEQPEPESQPQQQFEQPEPEPQPQQQPGFVPRSFQQPFTPRFKPKFNRYQQPQLPQQPKKPSGHLKIIGGEMVENGFRYIVLSDMSMKIGDEIDWFE